MLKNSVTNVGARTQPCFTPFASLKGHERMLLSLAVNGITQDAYTSANRSCVCLPHPYIWNLNFKKVYRSGPSVNPP